MASNTFEKIDTVIIGNGPSALILSYILHGHIPYYKGGHPDALLHTKLSKRPNLLDQTADLYAHFRSSLRYSTQALPVNTFLDTLLRPNADTEINPQSCVEWKYEPEKAVPHAVLGKAGQAGGQWAEEPLSASSDIGTLSYTEMLSLPGYSFADHYLATRNEPMPEFNRPSRAEVADYLRAYPAAVGIAGALRNSVLVERVERAEGGFVIEPCGIQCENLVLASGIFSIGIPPPPLLAPLSKVHSPDAPLLVVGSGFSAADVIISAPPERKIIHLFKWAPEDHPSPLRGCHQQAYPEYAGIYRQMKLAAMTYSSRQKSVSPVARRRSSAFLIQRNWTSVYEGFPNAEILNVNVTSTAAKVTLRLEDDDVIEREVGGLEYKVGRRGSLGYLSDALLDEVLRPKRPGAVNAPLTMQGLSRAVISGRSLRKKAELDLEVAPRVFIIGSLAGDSLVRHAFGTCVKVASKLIKLRGANNTSRTNATTMQVTTSDSIGSLNIDTARDQNMSQAIGKTKSSSACKCRSNSVTTNSVELASQTERIDHSDLHLDRRKLKRPREIAVLRSQTDSWRLSEWWGGLFRLK